MQPTIILAHGGFIWGPRLVVTSRRPAPGTARNRMELPDPALVEGSLRRLARQALSCRGFEVDVRRRLLLLDCVEDTFELIGKELGSA